MPKEIPDFPSDWKKPTPVPGRSYDIELSTPMVGGGARPGEVDLDFPIRPTAIRGHLRHWWRLIRGQTLGDGMWQREEEIFGSTEFPSPLEVRVEASPIKDWIEPSAISTPSLKYLLFPSIESNQRLAKEGLSFRLNLAWENEDSLGNRRMAQNKRRAHDKKPRLNDRIASPDQEIDLAIRAWLTFGGVGARTRRGCGALFVKKSIPMWNVGDAQSWLRQFLQPSSGIEKILCFRPMSCLDAWRHVADIWKSFRQPEPTRCGEPRRRFPEAETIRRATGRRSRRGRAFTVEEMPNGFPRAELGLPIIFQFKDTFDPEATTVNRSGADATGRPFQRMASPLILKPFITGKDQSIPMIVLLKTPRVDSVRVSPTPQGDQVFSVRGSPIVDSPIGSAIEAFLKFADAAGFKEVSL